MPKIKKQFRTLKIIIPIVFTIFFCLFSYKLLWFTEISYLWKFIIAAWLFVILTIVFGMPLFFWTKPNRGETKLEISIQKVGNYAQGYFSYIFTFIVFRDLVWLVAGLLNRDWIHYDFKEMIAILILPLFFALMGRAIVILGPFQKKIKIDSGKILKKPLKIVQISDLHIGPGLSIKKVQEIVNLTNEQQTDLIVLTGDIVDHLDKWFVDEINLLGTLRAKQGVFFIPGNHEYYWGAKPIFEKIKKIGIHVLLNENKKINFFGSEIAIAGTTDYAAKTFSLEEPDIKKALDGAEKCDYRILLAHQPKIADQVIELQRKEKIPKVHLQLSGHTHGGQFIPWSLLIRFFQKYTKGLYQFKIDEVQHSMNLYVSQGTGFWGPPDRLGTIPELTLITIE